MTAFDEYSVSNRFDKTRRVIEGFLPTDVNFRDGRDLSCGFFFIFERHDKKKDSWLEALTLAIVSDFNEFLKLSMG